MTSKITKKRAYRTGHRNSTERKIESANEILNSLSGSKQRASLILYKSSLKKKLVVIQGMDKEILELSSEEDIVREIEETDLFCSHVELALAKFARLNETLAAIAPKIEASTQLSKEPANEPAEPMNIPSYDPP